MAKPEGSQKVVNKTAIHAATAAMMALRGMDVGPHLVSTANLRELQYQRHDGLALEKPSFNWNVQYRYVELLTLRWR